MLAHLVASHPHIHIIKFPITEAIGNFMGQVMGQGTNPMG